MKQASLLFALFFILSSFADDSKGLTEQFWGVGKTKVIYGNKITRVEGKNDMSQGSLNVGYQTAAQLVAETEKRADKEMWSADKKKERVESIKRIGAGGAVHLYITRLTVESANTRNFTVIVKDAGDQEIYRNDLESSVPETPVSGGSHWTNFGEALIPKPVSGKFFIYVIDKLSDKNGKFKFEVDL